MTSIIRICGLIAVLLLFIGCGDNSNPVSDLDKSISSEIDSAKVEVPATVAADTSSDSANIEVSASITADTSIVNSKGLVDEDAAQDIATTQEKTALTQEELDPLIGRYGEAEDIPEDFQFADAEIKLWHRDHLANIKQPLSLYYEFVKSGSLEDGFSDSVYLKILKLNEDGTKNTLLDFFTADRKQAVTNDNVTNITGNPILGIFMQGDILEMNRLTDGSWRHFQKQIKISLRNDAVVEPTTFIFNGKEYQGEKIYFSPYLNDPHRRNFKKYADKYYEFIFSDEIPGSLYQIKTVIPDRSKETAEPLILEILTLIDVKENAT